MQFLSHYRYLKGKKTNDILGKVAQMKKHPVFKRARFDYYVPTESPEKLIILLGQVHTVWKGKIGNRERKKIVKCQARLCGYYAFLERFFQVRKFGGEGMYEGLSSDYNDRQSFKLYKFLEKKLGISQPVSMEEIPAAAKKIFTELGEEWHEELRNQSNLKKIQEFAAAISGQTFFNYTRYGLIENYPIEGEKAYQKVLAGITHLGRQIEALEKSEEIKNIRSRGGKIKTNTELEKLKEFNSIVLAFNQVIGSDIREQSTLEILREKTQTEKIVVFTMGVGHRNNYLRLVKDYFRNTNTAFVFITPPELLINWWLAVGLPILLLILLFLIGNYI